jgi:protoporphyrinogen oxidase
MARPPPPRTRARASVVIVGAGAAGLSAAWRLARAGFTDFTVLELDPVVGGTARGGRSGVGAFPWGAHYITVPMRENAALLRLLDEMRVLEGRDADGEAVVAEEFLCREPQERLWMDGAWRPGLWPEHGARADDLAERARFRAEVDRWAAWRDARGRRAFALPVARCSDDAEVTALDRESAADWLRRNGFRSPRLRWFAEYACRDDYGATLADTSAWAMLLYWAGRVAAPGEDSREVITFPEGNARLIAHLHAAVAPRVQTDLAVIDVDPTERGVTVTALRPDGSTHAVEAERVIFAAPVFVAARAIRPWRAAPPPFVEHFAHGPWVVANLHLSRRPRATPGAPPAWDNVLYDSPSLGYVVSTHQALRDHGPTVWTWYLPLTGDPVVERRRALTADRDAWADIALTDLERAHPALRTRVERIDVVRWGHAMVRPRPGALWSGARAAAAIPFRGVHLAHSDLSGVALFEEAFDQGLRAAEAVLTEKRHPFTPWRG